MDDLKKPNSNTIWRIVAFLVGTHFFWPAKILLFFYALSFCLLLGIGLFQLLSNHTIFEFACLPSFFLFFFLFVALIILINKYEVAEKIEDIVDNWFNRNES